MANGHGYHSGGWHGGGLEQHLWGLTAVWDVGGNRVRRDVKLPDGKLILPGVTTTTPATIAAVPTTVAAMPAIIAMPATAMTAA